MARTIQAIAIHCAATRPSQDIGAAEIRKWHLGQGWRDIGYHWVIRRNGVLEKGRDEAVAGSHVAGHNSKTIGVCMAGGVDDKMQPQNNFTVEQWGTLLRLCRDLNKRYPKAVFMGHRDFSNVKKACPSFDVRAWARQHGLPV